MTIYIIDPRLTLISNADNNLNDRAKMFFSFLYRHLKEQMETIEITNELVLANVYGRFTLGDALLFCNPNEANMLGNDLLQDVFAVAVRNDMAVFPVAMTRDMRQPPMEVSRSQSFDFPERWRQRTWFLEEQLRDRCLAEANIEILAMDLAMAVIVAVQPTLTVENPLFFISHKRKGGEEVAAIFDRELQVRGIKVFRDLRVIKPGDWAQERIMEELGKTDVLVLLDTPEARASLWVRKEIETALVMRIPIIWVEIYEEHSEDTTVVKCEQERQWIKPAENADWRISKRDIQNNEQLIGLVDKILWMAFCLSRQPAKKTLLQLVKLQQLNQQMRVVLNEIDRKNLLYEVSMPRRNRRYPERLIVHIVQLFGRRIKDDDYIRLREKISGYVLPEKNAVLYDTVLALMPFGDWIDGKTKDGVILEEVSQYISELKKICMPAGGKIKDGESKQKPWGLIISGAFPECTLEYQHYITDAVRDFAYAVLIRGGSIIFGGHPTFQPLIFELARHCRKDDIQAALRLYLSRFFVNDPDYIKQLQQESTLTLTNKEGDDRNASLTSMRTTMLRDDLAVGLVAIGGKLPLDGHVPGVDEEVSLAQRRGLPVFFIGAAGGRATQLATEQSQKGWDASLNGLTPEENGQFLTSLDFGRLADMALKSLGV